MNAKNTIAQQLLEIEAIKLSPEKPFTWASGLKSPIYCDNRMSLSYPNLRTLIIDSFVELAKKYKFDGIAGVATAGIPHGVLLAEKLNVPFIYVRSASKKHGRQNQIEGDIKNLRNVLVIEDLISTGGSSLQAIDALKEQGLNTIALLAIFSYGFPKTAVRFQNNDLVCETITNFETLLSTAVKSNYISDDQAQRLSSWNNSPEQWSENFLNNSTKP